MAKHDKWPRLPKGQSARRIIYPTKDEYNTQDSSGKRKLTTAANKARKAKGLGAWVRKFYDDGTPDIGDSKGPRKDGKKRKSEIEEEETGKEKGDEKRGKKPKVDGAVDDATTGGGAIVPEETVDVADMEKPEDAVAVEPNKEVAEEVAQPVKEEMGGVAGGDATGP